MTRYKVADLLGKELDHAVGIAMGYELDSDGDNRTIREPGGAPTKWNPSADWSQGGPIIEREAIELSPGEVNDASPIPGVWWAFVRHPIRAEGDGQTPLVAAMRAYVASKFGDTVELPD